MKIIRWLLSLPAALLAWLIGNALGDLWVKYIYGPYIPWQPVTDFEHALFPTAFAFGAFVVVAASVAPSHQRVVAQVSAGIGAGFLAAITLLGLTLANSSERVAFSWPGLAGTAIGALGAFLLTIRAFSETAVPAGHPVREAQLSVVEELDRAHEGRSLEEKAEDLVDACRVFIGVIAGRLRNEYPAFFRGSGECFDRLVFFGTVACVNCSCVRLHFEVEKERRTPLELLVQDELRAWNAGALNAYGEVHRFVSERLLSEPDRQRRGELLFELASAWVVENCQAGRAAPHDTAVASSLDSQLASATAGYWRTTSNRNSAPNPAPHRTAAAAGGL